MPYQIAKTIFDNDYGYYDQFYWCYVARDMEAISEGSPEFDIRCVGKRYEEMARNPTAWGEIQSQTI